MSLLSEEMLAKMFCLDFNSQKAVKVMKLQLGKKECLTQKRLPH